MTKRDSLARGEDADRAVKQAVHDALLDHKRAGNPVAVWRDGKVVIVPPEEIVFPEAVRPLIPDFSF